MTAEHTKSCDMTRLREAADFKRSSSPKPMHSREEDEPGEFQRAAASGYTRKTSLQTWRRQQPLNAEPKFEAQFPFKRKPADVGGNDRLHEEEPKGLQKRTDS